MSNKRWVQKRSYTKKVGGKRIKVKSHRQRYNEGFEDESSNWERYGVIDYRLRKDKSLEGIRLSQDQALVLGRGVIHDFNKREGIKSSLFGAGKKIGKRKASQFQNRSQFQSQEITKKAKFDLLGATGWETPDTATEVLTTEATDFIPIYSSITGAQKFVRAKRNRLLYGIEIIPIVNILPMDTIIYIKDKGKKRESKSTINNKLSLKGYVDTSNFNQYVKRSSLPTNTKSNLLKLSSIVERNSKNIMESDPATDFKRLYNYNVRVVGERIIDSNRQEKMTDDFVKWRNNPNAYDIRYIDDILPKEFKRYKEINRNQPLSMISIRDKLNRDLAWLEFSYINNIITITGYYQLHPDERIKTSRKSKLLDLRLFLYRDLVNFADLRNITIRTDRRDIEQILNTFGSKTRTEGKFFVRLPHI